MTKLSKGEITRLKILDVAEKVFADVGFSKARLEDIAEIVGIQRATVLHYFATKQELYDRVEARLFADLQAHTDDRLTGLTDPIEQLEAVFDSWLDFHVSRPNCARIIIRNTADIEPRAARDPVEFSYGTLATLEQIVLKGQALGVLQAGNPMHMSAFVGGGILLYVCSAGQLGEKRSYNPSDPAELSRFRALMHQSVRSFLISPT